MVFSVGKGTGLWGFCSLEKDFEAARVSHNLRPSVFDCHVNPA